jgi:hypothetical protein
MDCPIYKESLGFDSLKFQQFWFKNFVVGLGYQGKDIVFKFIMDYSSLRDFRP